ncbi:MAG TPA: crosslink repair DNA glycosylase YcaQ family protein [Pseudonocardiaceae bacterium]|nr:crosslink repair DNA glycosylase YcaQ family protein [Pseudonocardiaceae bacterium]
MIDVDRARVLAYRVAAHQFDGAGGSPPVLSLGVQDTPYGSAALALAARRATPDDSLSLVWSTRGAPHLHRTADLPALAAALWPMSDADASTRIATGAIKDGAKLGIAAFTATATAINKILAGRTSPIRKGELSGQVSARIPEPLTYWCKVCQSRHISGALLQQAGLPGGARLLVAGQATSFVPIDGWPGVPENATGTDAVVSAYLRLLGPATPADAAKFLGTSQTAARPAWPNGLAEVLIDGRSAWLPADRIEALRAAPTPRLVRLLPPSDPFLQARDRMLLLPDKSRHKALWGVLGNPGALLVGGEIVGTWRVRKAGKTDVEVRVTPFERLASDTRRCVEDEARRVGDVRQASDVRVTIDS